MHHSNHSADVELFHVLTEDTHQIGDFTSLTFHIRTLSGALVILEVSKLWFGDDHIKISYKPPMGWRMEITSDELEAISLYAIRRMFEVLQKGI